MYPHGKAFFDKKIPLLQNATLSYYLLSVHLSFISLFSTGYCNRMLFYVVNVVNFKIGSKNVLLFLYMKNMRLSPYCTHNMPLSQCFLKEHSDPVLKMNLDLTIYNCYSLLFFPPLFYVFSFLQAHKRHNVNLNRYMLCLKSTL